VNVVNAVSGPAALGAVVFLVVAAWCFSTRRVDVSLAVLGLYLGLLDGYLKLRTGSQLVALGRDVLIVAITAGTLLRALRSNQPLSLPPLGGFVLTFAGLVVVEMFNPEGRGFAGALAGARQHLEFVPLFFLGYAFVREESQVPKVLLILVVCAAVGGVVSYLQSTLTPEQLASWGPGYRERTLGTGAFQGGGRLAVDAETGAIAIRPFGLGSDAGAGAVIGALALPALLTLIFAARRRLRLGTVLLALGVTLSLATSGSRAAIITAFVSLVTFGVIASGSRIALRTVVGLAIGVTMIYAGFAQLSSSVATQRTKSIVSRGAVSTYQDERGASLGRFDDYASEHPLGIGVGYGGPAGTVFLGTGDRSIRDPRTGQLLDFETQWNFLVLELGLPGIALFLFINLRLLAVGVARIRRISDQIFRWQLAAIAAPLAGLLVQGFAGITTASVPAAPYFWFAGGVLSYWLLKRSRMPRRLGSPAGASQ